jgi:hypothetical protein
LADGGNKLLIMITIITAQEDEIYHEEFEEISVEDSHEIQGRNDGSCSPNPCGPNRFVNGPTKSHTF